MWQISEGAQIQQVLILGYLINIFNGDLLLGCIVTQLKE